MLTCFTLPLGVGTNVTPLGMRILTSYSRLAGVQQGRSCYENGCDEDLIPQSPGHETILSNFPLICRANMPSMLTPQRCDAYQSQNSNHQLHPEIEIIIDNPERGLRRRRLQHGSMQSREIHHSLHGKTTGRTALAPSATINSIYGTAAQHCNLKIARV